MNSQASNNNNSQLEESNANDSPGAFSRHNNDERLNTASLVEESKIHELILKCNKVAMENLRNNDFNGCIELLKKAEKLLVHEVMVRTNNDSYRLLGITLNNLGCFYRRTGKLHVALRYLKKALEIEIYTLNDKVSVAGTHLNICVILSSMQRHQDAMKHAKLAVDLLELARESVVTDLKNPDVAHNIIVSNEKLKNIMTTIIISYFNLATEQEFLSLMDQAISSFASAHTLANSILGTEHPLTQTIGAFMKKVETKASEMKVRETTKAESRIRELGKGYNVYIRTKTNVFAPDLLTLPLPRLATGGSSRPPKHRGSGGRFSRTPNRGNKTVLSSVENDRSPGPLRTTIDEETQGREEAIFLPSIKKPQKLKDEKGSTLDNETSSRKISIKSGSTSKKPPVSDRSRTLDYGRSGTITPTHPYAQPIPKILNRKSQNLSGSQGGSKNQNSFSEIGNNVQSVSVTQKQSNSQSQEKVQSGVGTNKQSASQSHEKEKFPSRTESNKDGVGRSSKAKDLEAIQERASIFEKTQNNTIMGHFTPELHNPNEDRRVDLSDAKLILPPPPRPAGSGKRPSQQVQKTIDKQEQRKLSHSQEKTSKSPSGSQQGKLLGRSSRDEIIRKTIEDLRKLEIEADKEMPRKPAALDEVSLDPQSPLFQKTDVSPSQGTNNEGGPMSHRLPGSLPKTPKTPPFAGEREETIKEEINSASMVSQRDENKNGAFHSDKPSREVTPPINTRKAIKKPKEASHEFKTNSQGTSIKKSFSESVKDAVLAFPSNQEKWNYLEQLTLDEKIEALKRSLERAQRGSMESDKNKEMVSSKESVSKVTAAMKKYEPNKYQQYRAKYTAFVNSSNAK